ncbi:Mitochondria-eating protein [Schistosoma japonicum]|nr:Mitochondria-eating protein [Schistosoma japonicum]
MSESLSQLAKSGAFLILHENLERWASSYKMNTCDENVAMGCEIIELNARIQNQLFRLISICASEGGPYGGTNAIKLRLLPLLGNGIMFSNFPFGSQTVNSNSFLPKTYESEFLKYPRQSKTESDLIETRRENNRLRDQILALEGENKRLKSQICYPVKSDYDLNKDNTEPLKGLPNSSKMYREIDVEPLSLSPPEDLTQTMLTGVSPLNPNDPIQRYRQHILVMRFNELFSMHRIEAMSILKRYIDDYEANQKILFYAILDSFYVAKSHFRTYKNRVRKQIAANNLITTEILDELVQSHINIHASHSVDLSLLVKDVCLALERRVPRIRRPSQNIGFELIKDFLYETCKLAWECAALSHPLEVSKPACENELIDETKYRRSHDSSYPTLLIHHYIWPCLMQNERVLAKGEVCTRGNLSTHGYEIMSMDNRKGIDRYRNRLSSRSCSPVRPSTSPGK